MKSFKMSVCTGNVHAVMMGVAVGEGGILFVAVVESEGVLYRLHGGMMIINAQ